MKITYYILFIGLVMMLGCHANKDVRQYVVKIAPIGPSDHIRATFYIGLKKTGFKKKYAVIDEITDQNSLQNMVAFLEDNIPPIKDSQAVSYGSLEFSVYNAKNRIIDYYFLNGEQCRNYLDALIKSLENKNSDVKLIKDLKEKGLSDIPYTFR